jgi:ApaG protein
MRSVSESKGYAETTGAITVTVEPIYLEDQSDPDENHFVWAYHVRIENHGQRTVQLMTRHWRITDSLGKVHEVRGDGVVGEQPVLTPGGTFEYTSGTPLSTPSGIMDGSYQMVSETGERFDVKIPAFSLDSPHHRRQVH